MSAPGGALRNETCGCEKARRGRGHGDQVPAERRRPSHAGPGAGTGGTCLESICRTGFRVAATLEKMAKAMPLHARSFVDGAKMAYEMVIEGFAQGRQEDVRNLLSKDVFDGFAAAIDAREAAGPEGRVAFRRHRQGDDQVRKPRGQQGQYHYGIRQ